MERVEVQRRVGEDEAASIGALVDRASGRLGHASIGEERLLELAVVARGGTVPGFAGLSVHAADTGRLVAYGQIRRGPSAWDLAIVDAGEPDAAETRRSILRRALELAGAEGGGPVQLFVPKATAADDELAAAEGLAPGRAILQMRRPLPLEPAMAAAAEKIAVRPFRPGVDESAWLEVNNAAFASHPDQGGWDARTLTERESQAWFDPDGLLLAEEGGRLLGFCWTKVPPEEPDTGEIYVLGVAPGNQGAGLGAALLAAGCAALARRGVRTVTLYVDEDNAPALRLYRSAGFGVDHVDRVYTADLPPSAGAPAGR